MLNRIPDAEDSKDDREVGLHGCSSEVVVHPVSSRQQLNKVVKSDVQGNCHPDGWPQAVPSSNPVPELEHICLVNAELGDQRLVCASRDEGQNDPHGQTVSKKLVQKNDIKIPLPQGHKVFGNKARVFGGEKEPSLASFCVGDSLLMKNIEVGFNENKPLLAWWMSSKRWQIG